MEHLNRIRSILAGSVVFFMIITISGCYYDNEEYLYPQSAVCETDNMSFANDIWPVISASCTGCHSGGSPAGNISLENYTNIAASAGITVGNYSSLYGAVSHAPGNSPMPKNSNKLSDCTIDKIKAWIDQGALDN